MLVRTSSRFATFAHASSTINATADDTSTNVDHSGPKISSDSPRSATDVQFDCSAGYSRASPWAIVRMAAAARAESAPARSLRIARLSTCKPRSESATCVRANTEMGCHTAGGSHPPLPKFG